MTNNEIIINQAIAHGIYTKAEAQAIVAAKGCLPIHTFAEWKKAGYSVKRGEHAAITCDLWKYTERPGKAAKAARAEAAKAGQNGPDADAPDPHYYMAKAHLFTLDQVKPAGQDDAPKAKTPEEIAAYNKKLADERKARKAAQQAAAAPAPVQPAAECEQIHGNLPGLPVDLPANHDNLFHAQHRPVPLSYLFILGVTLRPGVPFRHSARRIITVVCRHPALLTRVSTRFRV